LAAQARDRVQNQDTVPRLESVNDIQPKTADEQRRAEYFDRPGWPKLLDMPPGTVGIVSREEPSKAPPPPGTPSPAPPTAEQLQRRQQENFRRAVCSVDAIAIGTPQSRRVLLTKSGSWLFTDLQVSIERWIVPGSLTTRTATFSFGAGTVNVAGRVLSVPGTGPRLNETAAFFLRTIKGSAGYSIFVSEQMSETIRETVSGLTFKREDFPDALASAAASCTSQDRRQR
jgi:hypothetical protein